MYYEELSGTGNFNVVFGCAIFWGCCKIGFSADCMMGLLSSGDTGNLIVFCFIPALPWPNPGLIWGTPFTSEVIIGFISCFSGVILGSMPLSMSCTSGKVMPPRFSLWPCLN